MDDYVAGKAWKQEKYQHILEAGYALFAERGIDNVTMTEIADASKVGRTTAFRYFPSKAELVVAVSTWKWREYIELHNSLLYPDEIEKLTGAQYLHFFIGSFLDLYRNHKEFLRFNYLFNSYLRSEACTEEQKQPYLKIVSSLGVKFHELYERGKRDGTLNTDVPEQTMFSCTFHIMLAAVTRYATGLAVVIGSDPESELVMLAEMLLSRFTKNSDKDMRLKFN